MSTQLSLDTSAFTTLDADGNGQASCGPGFPGTSWQPSSIAVSVDTAVNEAQCSVYLGAGPQPGSLVGATQTGSSGDSTSCSATVWPGQELIAVWTGGDPGATATMSVFGTKQVP